MRLIDKENGGHGSTINRGIKEAKGKYFKAIDGDDWVDSDALEKLLNDLIQIDSDLVLMDYKTYKMLELLALVIPLGTKLVLKPGHSIKASEEVQFHSWVEVNFGPLNPTKQWYITENNKWKTVWDPNDKLYHTYVDEQAHLDASRVGNMEIADTHEKTPGGKGE